MSLNVNEHKNVENVVRYYLKFLPPHNTKNILDIGSGITCPYRGVLSTRCEEYKSLDVRGVASEIDFVLDVTEGTPFEDNQWEWGWCSEVLEHIEPSKKEVFVEEVLRICKNIVFTFPTPKFEEVFNDDIGHTEVKIDFIKKYSHSHKVTDKTTITGRAIIILNNLQYLKNATAERPTEFQKTLIQTLYETVSKPSIHSDWFILNSGQYQHGRIGRRNHSPEGDSTPSGFMSVQTKLECKNPIVIGKKEPLPDNWWLKLDEIPSNKLAKPKEEIRIYKLLNKTPPKNYVRVLAFRLFKNDISDLKTYLPTQLKKKRNLHLVYFQNESDFPQRNPMIVPDDFNWIFSQRGRVLFTDKKIHSEKTISVIQKGWDRKIVKNKSFYLPIISQFSSDLFLDIQTDDYLCEFYTEKESREDDFGRWYLKLNNQNGILYHLFSNPVKDSAAWIVEKEESE